MVTTYPLQFNVSDVYFNIFIKKQIMKKLIEILKQFFGLGATAKAITTASQLKNEVKMAIVEVKEKVGEVKEKIVEVKERVKKKRRKPSKPKSTVTPEQPVVKETQKKERKPRQL